MGLDSKPSKSATTQPSAASKAKPSASKPAAISKSAAPTQGPAVPAPVDSDGVDVDGILSSLPIDVNAGEEDDVHVELTEADMNDPELLGELAAFGGGDEESNDAAIVAQHPDSKPKAVSEWTESEDKDELLALQADMSIAPVSSKPVVDTPPPVPTKSDDSDIPLEQKIRCEDIELLEKYIQLEKVQAISKKRNGDKSGALESLRAVKALEARYDSLVKDLNTGRGDPATSSPVAFEASFLAPSAPISSHTEGEPPQPFVDSAFLAQLKQRQLEYKQAALLAKKGGDMTRARDMLMVSKSLDKPIESLTIGGDLPPGFLLPPPPPASPVPQPSTPAPVSTSQPAAGSPTTAPKKPQPQASQKKVAAAVSVSDTLDILESTASESLPNMSQPQDVFNHLQSRLEFQRDISTTIAAHHFKAGRKDKALDYHKRKKTYISDLEALVALKASGSPPPAFVYESITYEVEQRHDDVGLEEADICVIRGFDLGGRASGVPSAEVESYVNIDFGWPNEETGKSAEGKGTSPTISKNSSPG
jgi:hypothetical protein